VKRNDRTVMEKERQKILLSENFSLGKEERGKDLNHIGKEWNTFGTNMSA
jgi:hypothetical protein